MQSLRNFTQNNTKAAGMRLLLRSSIMLMLLLLHFTSAERDFNFNESQVPLLEPREEPSSLVHTTLTEQKQRPLNYDPKDPYAIEASRCQYATTEILLSLVLKNHDWSEMTDNKKAKVLEKLAKFFAIPKEFIVMESVTKRDLYEMQKESIRRGNNKCHTNRRLGRVDFMIGCGTSYFAMSEPIVKQIGHQMKDGSINSLTEETFGWWVIWRKEYKTRAQRERRQAVEEGSGDYDYDYDYDGEDEETPETVTEVPSSTTHAHRHHHGVGQDDNNDTTSTTVNNQSGAQAASNMSDVSSAVLPDTTTPIVVVPEYAPENTAPVIKSRLQKFAVTSGKPFYFVVPEETFFDNEDQTNLRLEFTDKDGQELKPNSWLQFNAENRELYGLPLDDTVSKYQYRLSATDSGNATVSDTVDISVQQHHAVRTVNHEIDIAVKINERHVHSIDWQLKLINAIATTLGDESTSAIVVREIRQTPQDASSATFAYFNETLPTSECPEAELNNLIKRFDAGRLADLVHPTLGIKSITGQLIGACQKPQITKTKPSTPLSKNQAPTIRNQVDRVNATVGHLLVYKVPSDTFYDANDNELTLTLKTKEQKELSARHWLQFDSKNQEFYGIPKSGDSGTEEYFLVAEDSGGLTATDALVVIVNHAPKRDFSAYFKAYLGIRHEQFNADLQRKFVERIAALFGNADTSNIQIRSVTTQHDSDSTIVNFYNTTLYKQHNRCPLAEIDEAKHVYLTSNGEVRERIKQALGAELNLTNVQVQLFGTCLPQPGVNMPDFGPAKPEEPSLKATFGESYLYTVVLPAVIIVVMILLALIVACCLHRRRRKSGKMELGDEEERKSFRPKGIPVIFQDELDEKPEIGNKSPIILKDEKPPLLPPSYNTTNGDNDVDEYKPPPAVVVGGREARGKSPATPSYRKPPPYVSP